MLLQDLAQLIREGVQYHSPYTGEVTEFGQVSVSILHPNPEDHSDGLARSQRNDCSIVVRLEYAGSRVLLAADIESQGWQWILDRNTDVRADVLKFPHHGAWHEGGPQLDEIIDAVEPSVVVISVGSTNSYGHPANSVLEALRSRQGHLRMLCTQATPKCHSGLQEVAATARSLLSDNSRGGHSFRRSDACPCAGHVTVRLSSAGVDISPTLSEHESIIDLFESPQCR